MVRRMDDVKCMQHLLRIGALASTKPDWLIVGFLSKQRKVKTGWH